MSAGKFNLIDNGNGTSDFEIETPRGKGRKRTLLIRILTDSTLAKDIGEILEEKNEKPSEADIECMEFLIDCLDSELSN